MLLWVFSPFTIQDDCLIFTISDDSESFNFLFFSFVVISVQFALSCPWSSVFSGLLASASTSYSTRSRRCCRTSFIIISYLSCTASTFCTLLCASYLSLVYPWTADASTSLLLWYKCDCLCLHRVFWKDAAMTQCVSALEYYMELKPEPEPKHVSLLFLHITWACRG